MTIKPQLGQWYRNAESGDIFEIVAFDDSSASIEIQLLDGSVDEIDADEWRNLSLRLAEPPEDPGSGYEALGADHMQLGVDGDNPASPPITLESFEPELFPGTEDF